MTHARLVPLALFVGLLTITACARAAEPKAPRPGDKAPDFSLTDIDGKPFTLSRHTGDKHGKIVVLEWFNPDCPFVREAHRGGRLQGLGDAMQREGVIWVAINSGAKGKQGHGGATNAAGRKTYGITYPILLDPDGTVGKRYGATRTPELFVITPQGVLVYRGAIDNTRGGDPADVGKVINYVTDAVNATKRGAPVATPVVKPFGCLVKY